jgi:hypothetical protein
MKHTILRQLIALPLLLASLAMLHACGSAGAVREQAAAPALIDATVVMAPGQSIAIAPASAAASSTAGAVPTATPAAAVPTLRLDRVNDSRCRAGAVCVWAGYLSYSFTLTGADGTPRSFVLSADMPNTAHSVRLQGLSLTLLGVQPDTLPGQNEAAPDYRVSLRVSNIPLT